MFYQAHTLWKAAKIDTFKSLFDCSKGCHSSSFGPYMKGPIYLFLNHNSFLHLIGHIEGNPEEKKIFSTTIDPMSDQVLDEAWVVGMITWLPVFVGVHYGDVYETITDGGFNPESFEVTYLTNLLEEDDKDFNKISKKFRGQVLNKSHLVDIAKSIDDKTKLSPEDVRKLTWYLKARDQESSANPKDLRFNHVILHGELLRTTRVQDNRKSPPLATVKKDDLPTAKDGEGDDDHPTPSLPGKKKDTSDRGSTKPTPEETPDNVHSQPDTTSTDRGDRRITEEDALAESIFMAKPVAPGQRAPELRWPTVIPPDGTTH